MHKLVFLLTTIFCLPVLVLADDYNPPEPLRPWVSWVQEKNSSLFLCAEGRCVWPSLIQYQVDETKVSFRIEARLLDDASLEIPMLKSQKPKALSVERNGQQLLSYHFEGETIRLSRGEYTVEGFFVTKACVDALPIPAGYGLYEIQQDCGGGAFVRKGKELVRTANTERGLVDAHSLEISRRIDDTSPLKITTRLQLKVSGRSRPLKLESMTLADSRPYSITGSLPHYLSEHGDLSLQLSPGKHWVEIESYLPQPVAALTAAPLQFEDWSFVGSQRVMELKGGSSISPQASHLPDKWKGGSLVRLQPGEKLELKTIKRGQADTVRDSLHLSREIWPSINNQKLLVRDSFTGRLESDFRLDSGEQTELGRLLEAGKPKLITKNPENNLWGAELAHTNVNLQAISEYANASEFPALGWIREVESLSGILHIPPSSLLLTIVGAQVDENAWLDSWNLLEIFMGCVVVFATFHWFGSALGLTVALAFVLNHGEYLAPRILFLYLLALYVWNNVVTGDFWKNLIRILSALSLLALSVQALSFAKLQATQGFFPQMQAGTRYRTFFQELFVAIEASVLVWPSLLLLSAIAIGVVYIVLQPEKLWKRVLRLISGILVFVIAFGVLASFSFWSRSGESSRPYAASVSNIQSLDRELPSQEGKEPPIAQKMRAKGKKLRPSNDKLLATGPATPTWRWQQARFHLDTPIQPDQKLRIVMLGQSWVRALCFLRALLTLMILWLTVRQFKKVFKGLKLPRSVVQVTLVCLVLQPQVAVADFPPKDMLKELEQRVLEPLCRKNCSHLESMTFRVFDRSFEATIFAFSKGSSFITLPGPFSSLRYEQVLTNAVPALVSEKDGFQRVMIEDGRSEIIVKGRLATGGAIPLSFKQVANQFYLQSENWIVEGQGVDPSSGAALRLVRQGGKLKDLQKSDLTPLVTVRRTIRASEALDLVTEVSRTGKIDQSEIVFLPSFPGERVISGPVSPQENGFEVKFSAGQSQVEFSSTVRAESDRSWSLEVEQSSDIAQVWFVSCSELYNCQMSGIPSSNIIAIDRPQYTFYPYPGERLTLRAQELEVLSGASLTIDEVNTHVTLESKKVSVTTVIKGRASARGKLIVQAPEEYSITSVVLSGMNQGSSTNQGASEIIVPPGSHTATVSYERVGAIPLRFQAPELKLGIPPENTKVKIALKEDRWILWLFGPSWGPGVVYWAKLFTLVLAVIFVLQTAALPMSLPVGLMLTVGLSFLPTWLLWVPYAWLGVLALESSCNQLIQSFDKRLRKIVLLVLLAASAFCFYSLVSSFLLYEPRMLVAGNSSTRASMLWYIDQGWQAPGVISLPIVFWRGFALIWSLWLVRSLLRWLRETVVVVKRLSAV